MPFYRSATTQSVLPLDRPRLFDAVEKLAFVLVALLAFLDSAAFIYFPILSSGFWWAMVLNAGSTLGLRYGLPLWDSLRRRLT